MVKYNYKNLFLGVLISLCSMLSYALGEKEVVPEHIKVNLSSVPEVSVDRSSIEKTIQTLQKQLQRVSQDSTNNIKRLEGSTRTSIEIVRRQSSEQFAHLEKQIQSLQEQINKINERLSKG